MNTLRSTYRRIKYGRDALALVEELNRSIAVMQAGDKAMREECLDIRAPSLEDGAMRAEWAPEQVSPTEPRI